MLLAALLACTDADPAGKPNGGDLDTPGDTDTGGAADTASDDSGGRDTAEDDTGAASTSCADARPGEAFFVGTSGFSDLQVAVDAAGDGGAVDVCPGIHTAVNVAVGDVTLTVRGWSGDFGDTTLDAGGAGRILVATEGALTVEDLTLQNGVSLRDEDGGGALYAWHTDLVLRRVRFVGNHAVSAGGAVSHRLGDAGVSRLVVEGCAFEANTSDHYAGALFAAGESLDDTPHAITLTATSFAGNRAETRNGAIELYGWWLDVAIEDGYFVENTVTDGDSGAGTVYGHDVALRMRATTFEANTARNFGGLSVRGDGEMETGSGATPLTLVIEGGTFEGNAADADGGALYVSSPSANVRVADTRFDGNAADVGGGAYLSLADGGESSATFERCTFYENMAPDSGGAVYASLDRGALVVTDSVFERNAGWYGGALALSSDGPAVEATLARTAFTNNAAEYGGAAHLNLGAGNVTLDTLTVDANSATASGGAFRILGETSGGNVGEATVTGGSYTTNTARDGGAFYVANAVLTVDGADLGSAATDNVPDDVSDCAGSWGTGASFVFDEDAGVYCE